MTTLQFNDEELLRLLAGQFAQGFMSCEEYLDAMESICRQYAEQLHQDR